MEKQAIDTLEIKDLPVEILDSIFQFVSLKNLCLQCSLVCSEWRKCIDTCTLWKIEYCKFCEEIREYNIKRQKIGNINMDNLIIHEEELLKIASIPMIEYKNLYRRISNKVSKLI